MEPKIAKTLAWAVFGASWAVLGASWVALGAPWVAFGASWAVFGTSWAAWASQNGAKSGPNFRQKIRTTPACFWRGLLGDFGCQKCSKGNPFCNTKCVETPVSGHFCRKGRYRYYIVKTRVLGRKSRCSLCEKYTFGVHQGVKT